MTLLRKIQIGLLALAVMLAGWQLQRRARLRHDRESVEAQLRDVVGKLHHGGERLAELEQRNRELVEAERRAGNQSLLTLMRERAAATKTAGDAASPRDVGDALARVLGDPEQRAINREQIRNQAKAGSAVFAKLLHMPPEQENQYVELQVDLETRKTDRIAALLRGEISLEEALRQRDADLKEHEKQLHEVLGDEGSAFLKSIADGMRGDEAKRTLNEVQQNLGDNVLNPDQKERLQKLVQDELGRLVMDDTDLFRTPDDWAQILADHQANVLNEAASFLTPAQLDALKLLATADLAQKKEQMILKRKSVGIR